jgi:hypothetical protein
MFYKVAAVTALNDYCLRVRFVNGETKDYDVKPLFARWPAFAPLRRMTGLFEQVHVDAHGYAIAWNDDIDLDCNSLYEGGH